MYREYHKECIGPALATKCVPSIAVVCSVVQSVRCLSRHFGHTGIRSGSSIGKCLHWHLITLSCRFVCGDSITGRLFSQAHLPTLSFHRTLSSLEAISPGQ